MRSRASLGGLRSRNLESNLVLMRKRTAADTPQRPRGGWRVREGARVPTEGLRGLSGPAGPEKLGKAGEDAEPVGTAAVAVGTGGRAQKSQILPSVGEQHVHPACDRVPLPSPGARTHAWPPWPHCAGSSYILVSRRVGQTLTEPQEPSDECLLLETHPLLSSVITSASDSGLGFWVHFRAELLWGLTLGRGVAGSPEAGVGERAINTLQGLPQPVPPRGLSFLFRLSLKWAAHPSLPHGV